MDYVKLFLISFCILVLSINSYSEDINICNAGAYADGKTLNTNIIQKSINMVSENGGGTVIVPPGIFLTGSLVLKNGVTIEVRRGAILLGSKDLNDYLSIQPAFVALRTGQPTKQLIFAEGQNNIAIVGEGTIDGQGDVFKRTEKNDDPGVTRPHLIQLINCKNVKIEGVYMRNSGGWMQHYLGCENLQITGINVYNHCNFNNDGIDIDGCNDVVVSGCFVDSDDDGICLKSTSPKPCRNVVISDCVVKSHCNALKMGTETTGGFQNITINNCVVHPSVDTIPIYGTNHGQSAISIEIVDGGLLDGVVISNITITETDCPIFVRLGNRARKHTPTAPDQGMGILRNLNISNIIATTTSKTTSNITGIPGSYAQNINLNNILITNLSEGTFEEANMEVRENDKGYPTAAMFGKVLPASGFFVRHVKSITFENVQIKTIEDNVRPVFVFHDVKDALLCYPLVNSNKSKFRLFVKDSACENIKVVN